MKTIAEFSDRFSELVGEDSYTKVGDAIGLSKQTVSAYAKGERSPKKPTIQVIAMHYGVNPAWLIGLDAPKYMQQPPAVSDEGLDEVTKIFSKLSLDNRAKLLELSRLYLDAQSKIEESQ